MNNVVKELTVANSKAVDALENEFAEIIDNGTELQPWLGDVDIPDPKDPDKILGTRVTRNVNVSVPKALMVKTSKAIKFLKDTSRYIHTEIYGNDLIAIATRPDEVRGIFIVQFAEPNQGSYFSSTDENAEERFNEIWGDKPAPKKVTADNSTEDVPF